MTDPFVGTLTFVRIYSGEVKAGTFVYNSGKQNKERVGRILEMHANDRKDIKCARTGEIVAIAGLKNTVTGETLCAQVPTTKNASCINNRTRRAPPRQCYYAATNPENYLLNASSLCGADDDIQLYPEGMILAKMAFCTH